MAKDNYRKGAITYKFIALPNQVVSSREWQTLSHRARSFAIDLMNQYTGKNNGRLCPGFEVMRRSGWGSKDQVIKAKRELLTTQFCIQTRIGHAPRTAEWLGFTWWKLDWHESMGVSATAWPYMNFIDIERARIDPNEGRKAVNATQVPWSAGRTDGSRKRPVCGPQPGPMKAKK